MRNSTRYSIAFIASFAFVALAQTNLPPGWSATKGLSITNSSSLPGVSPAPNSGLGLVLTLIPLVVPLLIAAAKTAITKLPTWTLPILAAALGALLNWISGLAGGPTTTILNGALLGAAGTGLREIVDQLRQKVTSTSSPPAA